MPPMPFLYPPTQSEQHSTHRLLLMHNITFEEKLKKVAVLKATTPTFYLKTLHKDFQVMLVKYVRNTKRVNWIANKGKYTQWKMEEFLREHVQECYIFKLELMKNYLRNSLVDCLAGIRFRHLQLLNLEENWITSIELICYIEMPQLRWLNLNNNHFIDLKPLRKMVLPKLRSLKLDIYDWFKVYPEFGQYNRHHIVIAREIVGCHVGSCYGQKMVKYFTSRKLFYPAPPIKYRKHYYEDESD